MFKKKQPEDFKPESSLRGQVIIDFIIYRSKIIEKIFAVLFLISAVFFPFVGINYDLSKYLPSEMPSKQGISLMEKEFGYPGTARIMISNVTLYEAKNYKDRIKNIKGVDMVIWADSVTDIYQSDIFIPYEDIEDYYKDGNAVMDVTFTGSDSDQSTRDALREMKILLGDKGYFSGSAVQNKFLNEVLPKEMIFILIFSVIIILGILTLATNSWFEPVVFLTVILISIVINMGSNIIFGSISSITLSIAAVLQLAVAMDYTIILLDNFTKERKHQVPVTEALSKAIRKSFTPVSSAGGAAIVGFMALVLMRFGIGRDIGLVLAKGIGISLVTVMFLTPAFILRWNKLIEKTEHKSFVPSFVPAAEKIHKYRYLFLLLLLLTAVPAYIGKDMTDFTFGNDAMGLSKGTIVYNDEQKINSVFGRNNLVLVIVPNSSIVTEKLLSSELEEKSYVRNVTSLANTLPEGIPEGFLQDSVKKDLHTEKYARILMYLRTATESDLAFNSINEISQIVKSHYPEDSYIIGTTPSTMDIKNVIVDDWSTIDKVSLLGVALAIMLAFRSLALPVVLMIPIQMAIFVNMTFPYLLGNQIMFIGYVVVSCLQLGATIDYSIVMTYHYLEWRKKTDKVTASIKATADSMLPILTSGLILAVAGFGVGYLSSVQAISDLGTLIGRGAILSTFMVIALLPNLFLWFDRFIIFKGGDLFPGKLGKILKVKNQVYYHADDVEG
jgi:predicted RND superfamily exporter protein